MEGKKSKSIYHDRLFGYISTPSCQCQSSTTLSNDQSFQLVTLKLRGNKKMVASCKNKKTYKVEMQMNE
ncbi:hypothetical protein BLOT_006952 [Blomia tropicalis]|nr:hypothetical protein BLOT_006952 [Blomia tropicalis]